MSGGRVIDGFCTEDGCRDTHVHHFICDWCMYQTADPRCWAGHVKHCVSRIALLRRLHAEAVHAGGER